MELLNTTRMNAGYTMGLRPDGRELLVVVVKGTFEIPAAGEEPPLAAEQVGLVMADEFTGEPGFSATRYESDFVPFKPRCDLLLNGSAHAPGGRPVSRTEVALRVAGMEKRFAVVGNRRWKKFLWFLFKTSPELFTRMPISYETAFGGVDKSHRHEKKHRAFAPNPVGRGFHSNRAGKAIDGKPLPNTEDHHRSIANPGAKNRPMAFGPIGRSWPPRLAYAGTYDQKWIDNVFPFLPTDFDERYYQCAPEDQQIAHPRGGEEVVLHNLTPAGRTRFTLPLMDVPVTFYYKTFEEVETKASLDTLILEPDHQRFMLVWRATIPLKKNIFEMAQAVVGRMSPGWYRARKLGKTWYPSLAELVRDRQTVQIESEVGGEEDEGA